MDRPGDRAAAWPLAAIVALGILLRIVAALVLRQPLASDPLSYFTMARGLAEHGTLVDNFGQHAFYSAGYPLVLAPFFAVLGSGVAVALAVNMILAGLSIWLVHQLAITLSGNHLSGLLAAAVFALWFPAVWNATMIAKENLSTPLLLAVALGAVNIVRGHGPHHAVLAGVAWGAALVTGGSALLLCAGVGVALIVLWRDGGRFSVSFKAGLCFMGGALVVLAPWLVATDAMVGRPVLTTNAPFNLYLGNNPAATGRFVSIADTPLGHDWEGTRMRLGEVANADRLETAAVGWIAANPGRAGALALKKLALFWEPNIPDAADFAASRAVAALRLFEVAQFIVIMVAGGLAFALPSIVRHDKWVIGATIAGFWLIHATAYVITRYRDPVVPLLIVTGSIMVAGWWRKGVRDGG
ncbi:hypothetical protein [Sphingomonas sp.]|uniref:hypothetical protein n=1 Tax=Sphingomonas sp. TaxID=28214 RepID=UPI0025F38DB3|nr:hypothetical protein [Sphingomonas sp.]